MLRPTALALAAAALFAVAVGCSGSQALPSVDESASPYRALLTLVPDTPVTRDAVFLVDYELIHQFSGLEKPGPGTEPYDVTRHRTLVTDASSRWADNWHFQPWVPFLAGYHLSDHSLVAGVVLAFDIRNVRTSAAAGTPEHQLIVMVGDFVPAEINSSLEYCKSSTSVCAPYDRRSHREVDYYSWNESVRTIPFPDLLGRFPRIAVSPTQVLQGFTNDGIELLVDTGLGRHDSLADVEDFILLADAMTELGAAMAVLSDRALSVDAAVEEIRATEEFSESAVRTLKQQQSNEALSPFTALAVGIGNDEQGPYMVLALVHANPALATANVAQLSSRIAVGVSFRFDKEWDELIDDIEVRSDGRVLLAKLRGQVTRNWEYIKPCGA